MAIRLSRQQRAAASNRGATRLPPVSPAFLKEEDAAYWAHLQIGTRREREYGGVILRDATGKYFATEPLPGADMQFDLLKVLALSAEGYYQQPKGYTCVASYHSHPAQHALIQARNPSFDARMVKAFLGFFSGSDFTHDVDDREFFPAAYLSGPDGSLIRYAPSGSYQEHRFALWIRSGKRPGNPVGVYGSFDQLVKKISTLGELSLIVPTALWGGDAGKVPADWVVFEPFTSKALTPPLCTSIFTRAEDAVKAAQVESAVNSFGFVLKQAGEERYVATFPSAQSQPSFSPTGVFPKKADNEWALPANHGIEAIYVRASPSETEVSAREGWLYSTFVTPAQMMSAINQARATRINQEPGLGLGLYAQVADGALLKIKVPHASAAGDLVNQSPDGVLDDNGAQAALADGTLSPRDYVRRVIAVTELSVVQPGALWRDVGPVDTRSALLTSLHAMSWNGSFLSATDAAVYAHEQVGNRRDRYYGGYILKGEDGRFIATRPVESPTNPFDGTLFFPVDAQGPLIPPPNYELHGRYGSHPALSMVDPAWVEQRRWSREEALINLQVFSPEEARSVIASRQTAYLSGGQDVLLSYTPGSTSRIEPFAIDAVKPAQWVARLAESGDLRVIDGNPLWGPRAKVQRNWLPHFNYARRLGPPDYTTYGAVFTTADLAARNLHARVHGRNLASQDCFAFVLKHEDKQQFIATEVVCIDGVNTLFKLNSLFAATGGGDYRFPNGFVLHSLFRSQQWKPTGLNAAIDWLTAYFVRPNVLYVALYDSVRRGRKYNNGSNLPVYFSNLEGALLRYVPSPITIGSGGPVDAEFEESEALLASGQTPVLDFVRTWAQRGQLHVVRTSPCWDKLGAVSGAWSGYENIMRRRLSPAFASPDDAVRHVAALVGEGRRRIYGGVVLRLRNGLFAATEPLAVPPRGFTIDWIYPGQIVTKGLYPTGSTIVARYSSLVEQEVPILLSATEKAIYTGMIPTAVLSTLLHREAHIKREYVLGFHGSILSYQLSNSALEEALKNRLAARNLVRGDYADNQVEQQIREGTLRPLDFVTQVAKAGSLRVIEGSVLWGPARPVREAFIANIFPTPPLLIRATQADPPCSPIFTRAFDAVRHVQLLYKPTAQLAFGYVLKAIKQPLYMATLPLVRDSYARLAQVFVGGQLPQGYRIEGLYLCAHNEAISEPGDDMVYSFFGPQEIANALNFVKNSANGRVPPLYLLCADGALLSYQLTATDAVYGLVNEAHSVSTRLLEGSMRVQDYVLDLATKGDLYIRLTSRIWGRQEPVSAQWHSERKPHSFSDNPHLHSFCGPLFTHADDAARSARDRVGPFSGKDYLGAVLVPPLTPGYVALDPVQDVNVVDENRPTLDLLFWSDHAGLYLPPSHSLHPYVIAAVQAFYKVIPSTSSKAAIDQSLLDNFVAVQDLRRYVAVLQRNSPGGESCYLTCRGGALLKYIPSFSTQEIALLQPSLPPSPSELVGRLRVFGNLSVLDTDAFWTHRGAVGEQWQADELQGSGEDDMEFGRDRDEL
ncbi:DUF4329 domain-containing protein [Pseudomonas sp. ADAK13]|uniref:DUF4329 domain-containing protein n=1 Tax=Pseudomonas sp. ADAK13 TaxID=2730847 RepID=UPI00146290DE|nr:DUF4329 domain-containing protein [Pseudomonas sp. ADAK13]QJI34265.1 DUF4329 domain-containing protein [Pseudomonas sp. ADAK13]